LIEGGCGASGEWDALTHTHTHTGSPAERSIYNELSNKKKKL